MPGALIELAVFRYGIHAISFALDAAASSLPGLHVGEKAIIGFELNDVYGGIEFALWIGDESLDESLTSRELLTGEQFSDKLVWIAKPYFESCVGSVQVELHSRESEDAEWQHRLTFSVLVSPQKITLEKYHALLLDIRHASAGLIFDIVSKNRAALVFGSIPSQISPSSANIELRKIQRFWEEIEEHLAEISEDPVVRPASAIGYLRLNDGSLLDHSALAMLGTIGINPRLQSIQGVNIRGRIKIQSLATPEHKIIRGVLEVALSKCLECIKHAQRQMHSLESNNPYWLSQDAQKDIARDNEARLKRLSEIHEATVLLAEEINTVLNSRPFSGLTPSFEFKTTPVFENIPPYRMVLRSAKKYFRRALWTLEDGLEERIKRTHKLYEYWVFFQLASAFGQAGWKAIGETSLFEMVNRRTFTLDLARDTTVTYVHPNSTYLRIRFDPWIRTRNAATTKGDSLWSGHTVATFTPDIVIEFFDRVVGEVPDVKYAVIVDAKYRNPLRIEAFDEVRKYFGLRSTVRNRAVAKQVWLAFPGVDGFRVINDAVQWDSEEADRISETIEGFLAISPSPNVSARLDIDQDTVFSASTLATRFAAELTRFVCG